MNVSEKVKKSFTAEFAAAQDVVWTTTSNYYRASFLYNGSYVNAYYSIDEDLVAVTRNISPADLPVSLQAAVKRIIQLIGLAIFWNKQRRGYIVLHYPWKCRNNNHFEVNSRWCLDKLQKNSQIVAEVSFGVW